MSRSGYTDEVDNQGVRNLYRASVKRAIEGPRGQAFLRDLAAAMDAMPVKELISGELVKDGQVCAIGAVCQMRGIDVSSIDPEDTDRVAKLVGVARSMAAEIVYLNDEDGGWDWDTKNYESPSKRWIRMRAWVQKKIKE